MSNKKLIKDLKVKEIDKICENGDGCANCPLLISSKRKKIRCIIDNEFTICEIEKAHEILNTEIDLDKYN